MARIFKKKRTQESSIDLTPMLDVVFIMLIFFIVTASFVTEQGFFVERPQGDSNGPVPENVVFVVSEQDEIWLEGRRIDVRSVRANIEQARAENPQASVIVRAHERASAGTYVGIVDQAEEVITDPNFVVSLVTYRD